MNGVLPATAILLALICDCRQSQEPDFPISNELGKSAGPAASVPSSLSGDVQADDKARSFAEAQAKIVLNRAANSAGTCVNVVSQTQPHGEAMVTVTFSGVGKSTKAIIGAPFEGKPIGNCVVRAFVNIIVKPFTGPDVEMTQKVSLRRK